MATIHFTTKPLMRCCWAPRERGRKAPLRAARAAASAIVRSATELSTPRLSPRADPGSNQGPYETRRAARAVPERGSFPAPLPEGMTTVGFEPTPEDQCLKLAP